MTCRLNLDTILPTAGTTPVTYTDADTSTIFSSGDTPIFSFSEAAIGIGVISLASGHRFDTGATASRHATAAPAGTQLTVTLRTTSSALTNVVIEIVGVADVASNTATIDFTIP